MTMLRAKDTNPLEGGPSFSLGNRAFRAVWGLVWLLLASWTPPPFHAWRAWLLRRFGADVHARARVYGSARIWYPPNLTMHANAVLGPGAICYCMAPISIGEKAIVSQRAHLCAGTHDIRDPDFQLVVRPIVIGPGAWVAAETFIGPGVTVGEGAVVGARSAVFRDVEPYAVYLGNPAVLIKRRELRARN